MKTALSCSILMNLVFAVVILSSFRPEASEEAVASVEFGSDSAGNASLSALDPREAVGDAASIEGQSTPPEVITPNRGIETLSPQPIHALPGLSAFEFRPMPPHPAERLAAEIRDSSWAAGMEGSIYAAVQDATDELMTQIEVQCRTTMCGIVIVLPVDGDRGAADEISDHLKETLGFTGSATLRVGADWQWAAIYLTADR